MKDKHEPASFNCNFCGYKATCKTFLNVHRSKEHEGLMTNHEQETKYSESVEDLQRSTILSSRVAGLGRLSAGAKMARKPFVKRVFTTFATNASFLRVISNFRI